MRNIFLNIILMMGAACASAQAVSTPGYLELADSARYYIGLERWRDAARCTREALRLEPGNVGNVMLFSNLGLACGMEGKYGEAMECFDIALSRAPKSIPVLTAKAKIQVHASDTAGALETLDTILALDSVAEWPLLTRGLLRMQAHEYKAAANDLLNLTKQYPQNSWGPAGMAKCMEVQGYPSEAAGYYRDALERCKTGDPDKIDFQLGLIENLGHTEKIAEALDVVRDALEDNPHEGRLYLLRGWLRRKMYLYREAEADKKLAFDYGVDAQTIARFLP